MADEGKIMQTNILLPEMLWEQAKMKAVKDRVSFTEVVRRALTEYLTNDSSRSREQSAEHFRISRRGQKRKR
jgi:hypothetical protein